MKTKQLEVPKEKYPWGYTYCDPNPRKRSADSAFRSFFRSLEGRPRRARMQARASFTYDDSWALIEFAQRAAIFALREQDSEWIALGMAAVAISQSDRRDAARPLGLLIHAAFRLELDVDNLLKNVAEYAAGDHKDFILSPLGFIDKFRDLHRLKLEEVQTTGGIGFVSVGSEDYGPTHDLKALIVALSEIIRRDNYCLRNVEIASEAPIASKVSGSAAINASSWPDAEPQVGRSNQLEAYLAETESRDGAQKLRRSVEKMKSTRHTVLAAFAQEKLFCLLIARSHVQPLRTIETPETLARFSEAIGDLLRTEVSPPD